MFSVRGPKFKYFAIVMAVICIIAGVYLTFFHSAGYVKTEATVVSIVEEPGGGGSDDSDYIVTVGYTVDGQSYQSVLDSYSPSYREGKTIDVLYNPDDPSVVHGADAMGIYALAVGIVILVIAAVSGVKTRRGLENAGKTRPIGEDSSGAGSDGHDGADTPAGNASGARTGFAPSVRGEEREVYFLTDVGTPKYGHRIEDRNRKVLYEAKMTSFSLVSAYGFDFIDHEHGTVTPHLVGHEEESDWNSFLLDTHYTFELDGVDVWKYLKQNGISVETERMDGAVWPRWRVTRDGQEIAVIESSSRFVHEEDAEKHAVMNKVAVPGFYRIRTGEENLDAVFMTAMAFGRSGALNDEGGAYGKIIRDRVRQEFAKED
ncbi:MAG: DUF3592 domain-containing protein [Eubacteriales bacterium]|nr:DUF3592 domain-containing protein [Eubacteriales bacterium]